MKRSLVSVLSLLVSCSPLQYMKEEGSSEIWKHIREVEQEKVQGARELAEKYQKGEFLDALLLLDQLPESPFLVREAGWIYLQQAKEHRLFQGEDSFFDCASIENYLRKSESHLRAASLLNPKDSLALEYLSETETMMDEYQRKPCRKVLSPPPLPGVWRK